ncbi:MAG: class I SAM-dependent methyltransferase [candidate division WOR-3 bacterium]|nr:class I SAM-dependent methyltransferase [candidate division WOR-3 bacterium]
MVDKYRQFYELAGKLYPEDRLTYSSLSGIMRKKWVLKKISQLPPGNLLDCGCNIGRLSAGWKKGMVIGIDIAYSLLEKGKKIFPDINFIQGDLRRLEFLKENSIDNAIAIEVLEHLDRVDDFFKGILRILKPGGRILITTPSYSGKRPVMTRIGILKSYGIRQGVEGEYYLHTAYKPEELKELVVRTGFQIDEWGSFEFETRGWVKPFTLINRIYESIAGRFFPCSLLNIFFVESLNRIELDTFYILDTIGLSRLVKAFFKDGRRSYVIAKKPELK